LMGHLDHPGHLERMVLKGTKEKLACQATLDYPESQVRMVEMDAMEIAVRTVDKVLWDQLGVLEGRDLKDHGECKDAWVHQD